MNYCFGSGSKHKTVSCFRHKTGSEFEHGRGYDANKGKKKKGEVGNGFTNTSACHEHPSGVTAFCFWLIEEKMKRERQEREQKEAIRQQSEILLIKSVMAAIALGEAAATALKNGHANGETEAALEYARKIKHEQKDFLTEQGIKGIYE